MFWNKSLVKHCVFHFQALCLFLRWRKLIYDPFNAIEPVYYLGGNTEGISWLQMCTSLEENFYFILSEL
jgi:hypothetical protein